jgi:excisionase family DNA binding protein
MLDNPVKVVYKKPVGQELYTTRQAAQKAGISRQTLQAWIAAKKIQAPRVLERAGVRLWTEADIAKLKEAKPRIHRDFRPRKAKRKKK